MVKRWVSKPSLLMFIPLLLVLVIAAACGGEEEETPTPVRAPTSTTAPVRVEPTATPTRAAPVPTPTSAPTPTTAPRAGVPVVNRVRYAVTGAENETNRSWQGTAQAYVQWDGMIDNLIGLDPQTGLRVPELATSWEANSDLSTWTLKLRKGVQFHNGWGEFTAKDIRHSVERMCRTDSRLTHCPYMTSPKRDVSYDKIVEIVDDYTVRVTYHGADGKPATLSFGDFIWSKETTQAGIESSAHFQKRGIEGLDKDGMQGTGPYQYKGRRLGQAIIMEKKPEKDWMGRDPDFQEVEVLWIPEDASRYAAMQVGEIHIGDLPLDLQKDAEKKGLKLIRSTVTANNLYILFGGMYFHSDPKSSSKFDPTVPWVDIRVRKAMNMAINREEMLDFLYKGIGEIMYVGAFHPTLEGWDPTWPERYKTTHKYNPDEAKRLLAAAGYGPNNPIKLKALSYASPGEAETPQVIESVCTQYWAKVGIQCELLDVDSAFVVQKFIKRDMAHHVWPNIILYFNPPEFILGVLHSINNIAHHYEDDQIEGFLSKLRVTTKPGERDQVTRELGNYLFNNYVDIPLFWFRHTVVADPKVVTGWVYPGNGIPRASHYYLIKAVKK